MAVAASNNPATARYAVPPLCWTRQDLEQMLFFRGARFTRVNTLASLVFGVLLAVAFYLALIPFRGSAVTASFTQRGYVPYAIVLFSAWALMIIVFKRSKFLLQRKTLRYSVLPEEHNFVLSAQTVDAVLRRIHELSDDPRHFVLFNRIAVALANLRNLGRVSDLDEILNSHAQHDESSLETSYLMLQGLIWAIPVLGFIGTVEGLSVAVGGFGQVLTTTSELAQIKDALRDVTSGLSVAFETTLQGLLAALVIQLLSIWMKKDEEEFLDACSEYCSRNIVGRLRLVPLDTREA